MPKTFSLGKRIPYLHICIDIVESSEHMVCSLVHGQNEAEETNAVKAVK